MKRLEAVPALQLVRQRQVRVGVLAINAQNFESEEGGNENALKVSSQPVQRMTDNNN